VTDDGIALAPRTGESFDLFCDGQHVWSFTPSGNPAHERFVPWPPPMRPYLDGVARFRVEGADGVLYDRETRFGSGGNRIAFRDRAGVPVMIDKWGLIQRPFTGRGHGVVEQMVEVTLDITRILAEECGVHCWVAFGTLLGAAREGAVIGHDSDIDLAYLSDEPTPAAMAVQMFAMARALRRHGMRVLVKNGSFLTVLFSAPDGAAASIDIYTCFYVGDLLHESATVRDRVPRSAIEPLGTILLEGRQVPAPADPEALLVASYGPGWRTPDPSFRHAPGPEVTRRFDGWFGSLMRNRRDWERTLRERRADIGLKPSLFARWAAHRLPSGVPVVEVGSGTGADALELARRGWPVTAVDYARGLQRAAAGRARREGLPVTFEAMNLYDLRDVLTLGALVARRHPGPRALLARGVFGAVDVDGEEAFWLLASMLLRRGGTALLEFERDLPGRPRTAGRGFAKRYPVLSERVEEQARAAGASEVRLELPAARAAAGAPLVRLTARWHPSHQEDPR
jgi:hypothetical protein